jgi:hypothetical protein
LKKYGITFIPSKNFIYSSRSSSLISFMEFNLVKLARESGGLNYSRAYGSKQGRTMQSLRRIGFLIWVRIRLGAEFAIEAKGEFSKAIP